MQVQATLQSQKNEFQPVRDWQVEYNQEVCNMSNNFTKLFKNGDYVVYLGRFHQKNQLQAFAPSDIDQQFEYPYILRQI